jgi:hypothetical protein
MGYHSHITVAKLREKYVLKKQIDSIILHWTELDLSSQPSQLTQKALAMFRRS